MSSKLNLILCLAVLVQIVQVSYGHFFSNSCPVAVNSGTQLSGTVFRTIRFNKPSECCARCAATSGCQGWSMTGCNCYLYNLVNGNFISSGCKIP